MFLCTIYLEEFDMGPMSLRKLFFVFPVPLASEKAVGRNI